MKRTPQAPVPSTADSGSALIITLMVMALVAALGTTVATLSIRSLQSAQLAQQAGVAVDAADAGVAEALSFMRSNGVHMLCPVPTAATYNKSIPTFDKAFDLGSQTCVGGPNAAQRLPNLPYQVLIVTRQSYADDVGLYTIYSKGFGAGQAARMVAADVKVAGLGVPKGFFGHAIFGSGQVSVNQSIFSTGCVYNRGHMTITGTDAYGLPAAVHSSAIITDDNLATTTCPPSPKSIHCSWPGSATSCTPVPCASGQPFDQDSLGGSLDGTPCVTARPASVPAATWAKYYPDGSRISSTAQLLSLFGIKDPALSAEQIDRLRVVAQSQGNFYTAAPSGSVQVSTTSRQAVMFWDLTTSGGSVDLSAITGFGYTAGQCPDRSLVIVVVGGGAFYHSGAPLMASVFVTTPGKNYDANGGAIVGSVFADSVNMGGNTVVSSDAQACAAANPSPSLQDFSVTTYRELDS